MISESISSLEVVKWLLLRFIITTVIVKLVLYPISSSQQPCEVSTVTLWVRKEDSEILKELV